MTGPAYDSNLDSMLKLAFILNPFLSSLLCDSSCKQATQMPDDEVEKLSITTTSGGDASIGDNILSQTNGPSGLEKTMIEDISSKPLEEFQDSFGIYKEILPKNRILLNKKLSTSSLMVKYTAFCI